MNALVMYDRQTNSLWSQILGEAISGSMKGTKLEFASALHTTWADWKAQYPNTTALFKGYAGASDSYTSYYRSPSAGVLGETFSDARLQTKEFVIGVEQNGEAVAYPFRALSRQPVVNDVIGGIPVLIVFNANSAAGIVFDRRVNGEVNPLNFSSKGGLTLSDGETGSIWEGMTGIATTGALAGRSLTPVKSTLVFWFGWKDWYPNTRVLGQ